MQMAIHLFEVEAQTDDEAVMVDYEDPFDGFSILRAVKATMAALDAGELQVRVACYARSAVNARSSPQLIRVTGLCTLSRTPGTGSNRQCTSQA